MLRLTGVKSDILDKALSCQTWKEYQSDMLSFEKIKMIPGLFNLIYMNYFKAVIYSQIVSQLNQDVQFMQQLIKI